MCQSRRRSHRHGRRGRFTQGSPTYRLASPLFLRGRGGVGGVGGLSEGRRRRSAGGRRVGGSVVETVYGGGLRVGKTGGRLSLQQGGTRTVYIGTNNANSRTKQRFPTPPPLCAKKKKKNNRKLNAAASSFARGKTGLIPASFGSFELVWDEGVMIYTKVMKNNPKKPPQIILLSIIPIFFRTVTCWPQKCPKSGFL